MTQTHIILISVVVALLTTGAVLAAGLSWARSTGFGEERWSRHSGTHSVAHAGNSCGGDMTSRLDHLLPYLESTLEVTPDQRPQWNAFVGAVADTGEAFQGLCDQKGSTGTAPQRLARFEDAARNGLVALTSIREATAILYETFTDTQKSRLDELLSRRGRRHAHAYRGI